MYNYVEYEARGGLTFDQWLTKQGISKTNYRGKRRTVRDQVKCEWLEYLVLHDCLWYTAVPTEERKRFDKHMKEFLRKRRDGEI